MLARSALSDDGVNLIVLRFARAVLTELTKIAVSSLASCSSGLRRSVGNAWHANRSSNQ